MKKTTFAIGFILFAWVACFDLKSQTGSASGDAGGSRVDFSFPAQLTAGKYVVIPLPDQLTPAGLTDDGTMIFKKPVLENGEIGYRWKAGELAPLLMPAEIPPDTVPLPLTFDVTTNGWVMASFFRLITRPSGYLVIWPPGETQGLLLPAAKVDFGDGMAAELVFNPILNVEGRVWARVAFNAPDEGSSVPVKFAVWNSIFEEPTALGPDGTAITVVGVNSSGSLIGTYIPDFNDPYTVQGFVGRVENAVDFTPRLINDAGYVVGVRVGSPTRNILWREDEEVALPDGDIEKIDSFNNLHGYTPDGRHVMWTTDVLSQVSQPGAGVYQPIDYVPPILPTGWTTDAGVIPGESNVVVGQGTYHDPANPEGGSQSHFVLLVPAEFAVDANRDSKVRLARGMSSDRTSADSPFRYWINDDDDSGDVGGTDLPDASNPLANCNDEVVNGTRDLVDFFPVFLDIKQLLTVLPPGGSLTYKLKQADGALNFVYTNTSRDRALAYHREFPTTGFGNMFDQRPGLALTHHIPAEGVELAPGFLAGVKDDEWGVLLMEGRATTTAPLVLVVENEGVAIAEVKLDLRLSNVEDMFRHVDLTHIPTEYNGQPIVPLPGTRPSRTFDPGDPLPDSASNGKYFVFLHGFNVDGRSSHGWEAEIFKRMYVMGSHARFVGVNWAGAAGPKIGNDYPDYQKAVFQAFQTGDILDAELSFTHGADVTVAAHSLGNIVVSQAIEYGHFAPTRYYMINAAVALEAYDLASVTPTQRAKMTHVAWENPPLSNGNGRLFAANWHELFDLADHRSELKWKERFKGVFAKTSAYDFYSPGDDALADPATSNPSVLLTIMRQGFNLSHGAWATQELSKGTIGIASLFFDRTQAGWGESGYSIGQPIDASPSDESLRMQPFFSLFYDIPNDLISLDANIASAKAGLEKVQYDLLARGIPALSFATAVHLLDTLNLTNRNFDMEQFGRIPSVWPTEGHAGNNIGQWLHSDFKNVALPYVQKTFQAMIDKGTL